VGVVAIPLLTLVIRRGLWEWDDMDVNGIYRMKRTERRALGWGFERRRRITIPSYSSVHAAASSSGTSTT